MAQFFGRNFLGGFFWEDFSEDFFRGFFRRIFSGDFFGGFFWRNFLEEFFGRNSLFTFELNCLSRFWGNREGRRISILRSTIASTLHLKINLLMQLKSFLEVHLYVKLWRKFSLSKWYLKTKNQFHLKWFLWHDIMLEEILLLTLLYYSIFFSISEVRKQVKVNFWSVVLFSCAYLLKYLGLNAYLTWNSNLKLNLINI